MKPQDKLNRSARAHGWANWSEVLMHNAPAHVINLIVEEAMRGGPLCVVTRDDAKKEGLKRLAGRKHSDWKSDTFAAGAMWAVKQLTGESDVIGSKPEPALTWRPGARVRITGDSMYRHFFAIDKVLIAEGRIGEKGWYCKDEFGVIRVVHESDAVVVG